MARTAMFGSIRSAIARARLQLPDAPPLGPRAITRRSALALLAAAAACTPRSQDGSGASGPVAIVGSGTAGLVIAWRLANAGHASEIFDAANRTGGRMFTLRNFTPDGQFCELGGELVDSNHKALMDLCAELSLPIQRLRPEGERFTDLYDFAGKTRTETELLDAKAQTGAFLPVARRIAADQAALLDKDENWTARARELDALPLSKYLESLADSTERWVIDLLALTYHDEYGIPVENQSSLNLVDLIGASTEEDFRMFGDSDESHRIQGGSSTLPETLTARLSAKPLSDRVAINLNHELAAIARDGDGFKLTFKSNGKTALEKTFARVVLALPFTKLREVQGLGALGLSAEKMKAINEQGYGANSKLMVATTSRPWTSGLNGINERLTGTIYSDRGFQVVWDTSAGQEGAGGILTNFFTGPAAKSEETPVLATLQQGLESFSPELAKALNPKVRASFFWPKHPFTKASYSGCLTGQYTGMIEHAAQSELGGRLVFAGEHTSADFIGFMNGAVESGERAAKELLSAV